MCSYSSLNEDDHGQVVRCNECRHIHVYFGTTVLALSDAEFLDFRRSASVQARRHSADVCRTLRHIRLATPAASVMLLFNAEELLQLQKLLNGAAQVLQKEQLFKFNFN